MDQASVTVAKDVLGKLDELIKSMTGIVQQGGEYFWPILVKQQIIEGISCGVGFIFSLVIMIIAGVWLRKCWVNDYDIAGASCLVVVIVFGLLSLIFGIAFISDGVGSIINPEFYALQALVGITGGK